jgi:hypothetical protein
MFKSFLNYVSEVRQRWADHKTAPAGSGSLNFGKMLKDAQEEQDRLWENPPPCGPLIRYVQHCVYEDVHGEFLFKVADVEQQIKGILQENPHLANGDEGAILNWIKRRDESLTEPTGVPSAWARFEYVANDLVRAGKAEIHCTKCGTVIGSDQLATNDDSGKRGWNFDRVACQHGHNLLVAESVHLAIK